MRSRELKKMLAQAAQLTWPQRQELMQALGGVDEVAQVVQVLQSRPVACPHCQGERVVRNGHASRLPRRTERRSPRAVRMSKTRYPIMKNAAQR